MRLGAHIFHINKTDGAGNEDDDREYNKCPYEPLADVNVS
jgi:hypothetical protein